MNLPKKKQYPKDVLVGNSVWDIKFVRKIDGCVGLCIPSESTILIKLGQSKYETLLTMVHELVHAAEFEYDFELPETTVEKLEIAITNFILANWPLFAIDLDSKA